jgi:F-type H+-transporting ATPase subunit a
MLKKTQKKVFHFTLLVVAVCMFFGMQMDFTPVSGAKLSADNLKSIFPVPVVNITNSLLTTWAVTLLILVFTFFARRNAGIIPTKTQVVAESIIGFFLEKLEMAMGNRKEAKKLLPAIVTVFLLVLGSNEFGLLPFVGSFTTPDGALFRTPTADYSLTIALALLLIGMGHFIAFFRAPWAHFCNFIKLNQLLKIRKLSDIPMALLEIFLGILDIIGELAKIMSMSSRLFGNLVAGDLMIGIISGLAFFTAFLIPLPFIFLSAFSGVVQAFVFALLALQFMSGTIQSVPTPESSLQKQKP